MPSTAIQARISAFESLASPYPPSLASPYPPSLASPAFPPTKPLSRPHPVSRSPSPPNLGRKSSLIDLRDWVVDDGPADGRTPTQQPVAPLISLESPPKPTPKRPAASAPPLPPRKPSYTSLKSVASSTSSHSVPLSPRPPQRFDSLTVAHHTYPPLKIDADSRSRNTSGHAPASSISSFHSVSLSSDTDPSTPGSASSAFISTFPIDRNPEHTEADSVSLGESYEEVSTPSIASPVTERIISMDWEKAMAKRKQVPPKLPQRPSPTSSFSSHSIQSALHSPPPKRQSTSSSSAPGSPGYRASVSSVSSSSTLAAGSAARKPPPPPPSRSSDRASIQSTATSYSARSINSVQPKYKRPTPVPPAARVRYEAVFNANVVQQRKAEKQKAKEKPALLSPTEARGASRRAAGWRGLSVDLITGGNDDSVADPSSQDNENVNEVVEPADRLEGHLIKTIWRRSRLGRRTLGAIWCELIHLCFLSITDCFSTIRNECDPDGTGALTRDQFAKGMWRVDEELRRAQIQALKSTSTTSLGSQRSRGAYSKPPPVPRQKPILR
ncbi:hypothetical protein H0H87_002407 [Tephrocybe sp. NHM501043]|nr:hypothetical protein H0H87_002407 [Tephrocybe sp. NHM501043]